MIITGGVGVRLIVIRVNSFATAITVPGCW